MLNTLTLLTTASLSGAWSNKVSKASLSHLRPKSSYVPVSSSATIRWLSCPSRFCMVRRGKNFKVYSLYWQAAICSFHKSDEIIFRLIIKRCKKWLARRKRNPKLIEEKKKRKNILTCTITTLIIQFSGSLMGARKWRANATRRWRIATIFLEWMDSTDHLWGP